MTPDTDQDSEDRSRNFNPDLEHHETLIQLAEALIVRSRDPIEEKELRDQINEVLFEGNDELEQTAIAFTGEQDLVDEITEKIRSRQTIKSTLFDGLRYYEAEGRLEKLQPEKADGHGGLPSSRWDLTE